jgi:6-phosphogluconolactonase (cycloisomerase 2 family)
MKTTARLAGVSGLALAAAAAFAGTAQASPAQHHTDHPAAPVFVQTDNPSGNSIVVYDRSSQGTLSRAGSYRTGGLGGVLDGSVVDHLASQGSLAYDRAHGLLYAVNAGSNSVTVFAVHGDQLMRRQVLSSGGDFPVSLAVHGDVVYVLNARDGGSVQGYRRVGEFLLRIPGWHRDLGLDPKQTPEFTSTPGQVAFTPDGSKLIVTTKGNGSDIDVFRVDLFGGLSAKPVVNADPGAVPFAVAFDQHNRVVVSEAGPSAVATFSIDRAGRLSLVNRVATGQAATCWIVGTGSTVYASNAGSASLSGFRINGAGTLTALGNTTTDAGTVDATISSDGRYLYAQTGGNGIVDEFRVNGNGSLTEIGSVTVPGAIGGEGIVAS